LNMSPACIAQFFELAMFFSTSALACAKAGKANTATVKALVMTPRDGREKLIDVSLLFGGRFVPWREPPEPSPLV
jgi:hypothetical protein